MKSLATKWRPTEFEDVCSQDIIVKILQRQLEIKEFKNSYLFCGPSGCGKTTLARIFANKINENFGQPIEIDAASNNGVDNIKQIVKSAQERSLTGKYKIYILDECHSLTNQSWQALLKCIEEPPTYTIFIFCTTDPQKIPDTIINRCMRFNFTRIPNNIIKDRLEYICIQEKFTNYQDSIDYISRICKGQMRDAISYLDKVSSYGNTLELDTTIKALGNYSFDIFFNLVNYIIDDKESEVINLIEYLYSEGNDLKIFIDQYINFCLDIFKYSLIKSVDILQIPPSMENKIKNSINFDSSSNYYSYILDKLLECKNLIKTDTNIKSTIEVCLLQMCKCKN